MDTGPKPSQKDLPPFEDLGEAVIGEIPVVARLALGIERLRLVLTTRRLLVAHAGKTGASALASVSLLGKFALGSLEKGGKEYPGKRTGKHLNPDEVLRADKDNFQVVYGDVVRVELNQSSSSLRILILTKDDKFQFTTAMDPRSAEQLLRGVLGSKLATTIVG